MHLKSFEDYQKYNVGDFVMQDIFLVSEPKRYFKREREFQLFLFESNIVFTKREELSSKKTGYVFKDSMLIFEKLGPVLYSGFDLWDWAGFWAQEILVRIPGPIKAPGRSKNAWASTWVQEKPMLLERG
ncbi:unnamed protein product [Meloidogyne enterolobii]|uniref:Uncharacterized protein n=1 Tax=Meloidogyne enterolobii TaxID=390850 RepID=A0ACB0YPZ3_MELEN